MNFIQYLFVMGIISASFIGASSSSSSSSSSLTSLKASAAPASFFTQRTTASFSQSEDSPEIDIFDEKVMATTRKMRNILKKFFRIDLSDQKTCTELQQQFRQVFVTGKLDANDIIAENEKPLSEVLQRTDQLPYPILKFLVETLLAYGATVDSNGFEIVMGRDFLNKTAGEVYELIALLADKGRSFVNILISIGNYRRDTPLGLAITSGSSMKASGIFIPIELKLAKIQALLDNGASITMENYQNKDALDLARILDGEYIRSSEFLDSKGDVPYSQFRGSGKKGPIVELLEAELKKREEFAKVRQAVISTSDDMLKMPAALVGIVVGYDKELL